MFNTELASHAYGDINSLVNAYKSVHEVIKMKSSTRPKKVRDHMKSEGFRDSLYRSEDEILLAIYNWLKVVNDNDVTKMDKKALESKIPDNIIETMNIVVSERLDADTGRTADGDSSFKAA